MTSASSFDLKDLFCPTIGILSSNDAEILCRKNNMSFQQLLQPFSRITAEGTYRNPSGNLVSVRGVKLNFKNIEEMTIPPPLISKHLEDVLDVYHDFVHDFDIKVPYATPWFDKYLKRFFNALPIFEHEYLRFFIACIFAVSTSHLDPLDQFQKLQMRFQEEFVTYKWFLSDICRYYVLLHEPSTPDDDDRVKKIYDALKTTYGSSNCHLLIINSGMRESDKHHVDRWCQYLLEDKMHKIASTPDFTSSERTLSTVSTPSYYMNDSTSDLTESFSSLLSFSSSSSHGSRFSIDQVLNTDYGNLLRPLFNLEDTLEHFAERVEKEELNEKRSCECVGVHSQYLAEGDDISRIQAFVGEFCFKALLLWVEKCLKTLTEQTSSKRGFSKYLSVTKRLFGAVKSQSPLSSVSISNSLPPHCSELLFRRLADLSFLFRDYEFAFNVYHALKRDFQAEQTLYLASTLEMCALSHYLAFPTKAYPHHYMEQAFDIYIKLNNYLLTTRCSLVSAEILKSKRAFLFAARQYIRNVSPRDELRSALFMEQAALCLIKNTPTYTHKFSFYITLAGHCFAKINRRKHAIRCYLCSLEVLKGKGWHFVQTHNLLCLCKQLYFIGDLAHSMTCLNDLFESCSCLSEVHMNSIIAFYCNVLETSALESKDKKPPILFIPRIVLEETRSVVGGHFINLSETNSNPFEFDYRSRFWPDMVSRAAVYLESANLKFSLEHYSDEPYKDLNHLSCNETIKIKIVLENPLPISVILSNVHTAWSFLPKDDTIELHNDYFQPTEKPTEFVIEDIYENIVIQNNSSISIILSLTPTRIGLLIITGIYCNLNAARSIIQGKLPFSLKAPFETNLKFEVLNPTSFLRPEFAKIPAEMYSGQLRELSIDLFNSGSSAVTDVHFVSDNNMYLDIAVDEPTIAKSLRASDSHVIKSVCNCIAPMAGHKLKLALRTPEYAGIDCLNFMIFYSCDGDAIIKRHHYICFCIPLHIRVCVGLTVKISNSSNNTKMLSVSLGNVSLENDSKFENVLPVQLYVLSKRLKFELICKPTKVNLTSNQALNFIYKNTSREDETNSDECSCDNIPFFSGQVAHDYCTVNSFMRASFRNAFSHADDADCTSLTVGVLWKGILRDRKTIMGVHIISPFRFEEFYSSMTPVKVPAPIRSEAKNFSNVCIASLLCQDIVVHDFISSGLCTIPVTLQLRNCSDKPIIMERLELNNFPSEETLNVTWIGITKTNKKKCIEPENTLVIPLSCFVSRYGIYSVTGIDVTICRDATKEEKLQIPSRFILITS